MILRPCSQTGYCVTSIFESPFFDDDDVEDSTRNLKPTVLATKTGRWNVYSHHRIPFFSSSNTKNTRKKAGYCFGNGILLETYFVLTLTLRKICRRRISGTHCSLLAMQPFLYAELCFKKMTLVSIDVYLLLW
jgi:hypothetical protein